MRITLSLLFCAATWLLSGCEHSSQPALNMVGTYGVVDEQTGQVAPFSKIEASKDEHGIYLLYEYGNGGWHQPKKALADTDTPLDVKPFTKADLEKELRHPVDVDVVGFQVPGFAIVHVPAGWSDHVANHFFKTKTGYFALTLLGPVALVRL